MVVLRRFLTVITPSRSQQSMARFCNGICCRQCGDKFGWLGNDTWYHDGYLHRGESYLSMPTWLLTGPLMSRVVTGSRTMALYIQTDMILRKLAEMRTTDGKFGGGLFINKNQNDKPSTCRCTPHPMPWQLLYPSGLRELLMYGDEGPLFLIPMDITAGF